VAGRTCAREDRPCGNDSRLPPESTSMTTITSHIERLSRSYRDALTKQLARIGLYAGQDALLLHIEAHGPTKASALARALGVQAPTRTKMVHRRKARGGVETHVNVADRRGVMVELTAKGYELAKEVAAIRAGLEVRLVGELPMSAPAFQVA